MLKKCLSCLITALLLLGTVAKAQIAFDASSSAVSTGATTSINWSHTLGAGSNRAVVVGVVSRASPSANAIAPSVTFNGTAMIALPSSIAINTTTLSTVNRSQLFYLPEASLPAAGTYTVQVTFANSQSASNLFMANAISLLNVAQGTPAAQSNFNDSASAISTVVNAAEGSWVLDTIGVGSSVAAIATTDAGMVLRVNPFRQVLQSGSAASTQVVGLSGSVTMSWSSAKAREVQSLVVFAPAASSPPVVPPVVVVPTGALTVYVSPTGLAANAGTLSSPTTLAEAVNRMAAAASGVIWVRGGTYNLNTQITIARENYGAGDSARKRIQAYRTPLGVTEKPVLDFATQPYIPGGSNQRGLQINGNYWSLKGLTVRNAADNGIYIAGHNNIVEFCVTQANKDSGLQLGRASSASLRSEWPANNLILNCESFDNYDYPVGENADGFACKLTTGPGNIFKGCVSHHNIDDGWDLFTKGETGPIDPVSIIECVAYNNGVLTNGTSTGAGDRNGFKLGGDGIAVNHVVEYCIAFDNGKHGFTYNSNPGSIEMSNNTSWRNAQSNFAFDTGTHIFANNLSFKGTSSDKYSTSTDVLNTNCWWHNTKGSLNGKGLLVSEADFVSLVPPAAFARKTDGSLNLGNFLLLVPGSDLIDAGIPGGTDIGARESGGSAVGSPAITTQPTSRTVTVGATTTFTVVADGIAPLTYQWRKDGAPISGATLASLTLSDVQLADAAAYTVVVTNSIGFATSSTATLTVNPVPVVVAPAITTQPASQTVSVGGGASFTVVATGTAPLTYQWKKGINDIPGATADTLAVASAQLADAGDYSVVVSNSAGSAPSSAATLTVNPVIVLPSTPVASAATSIGSNGFSANWGAAANATGYRLDVSIDIAFGSFVTGYQGLDVGASLSRNVTGLAPATAYFYRVRATNAAGTSGSSNVITATTIVQSNISIQASGTTTGTTYSLTGSAYAQNFNSLPIAAFTWVNDTTLPGWFAMNTAGSFDPAAVITDGSGNLADLKIASVGIAANTERALAYHTRVNTAPTYVGVRFNNNSGRTLDSFTLTYTPEQWKEGTTQRDVTFTVQYRVGALSADLNATSGWTTLSGLSATTAGGSAGATATLTASGIPVSVASGTSVWFRWVTANSATTTTASNDTLAIDNVSVSFTAAPVGGAPTITTQPVSQSVAPGADVTFSVVADSSTALSYQWRKGVADIAGATSASFTISGVQVADAGNYSVLVTNAASSVPSNTATLTVNVPVELPVITTPPQSQSVNAGGTAVFTVVATSSAPLSYQWLKGNAPILSATSATLALTNVQQANAADYSVIVSNSAGPVTSSAATLTVNEVPVAPTITIQPANQLVTAGSSATFSVAASGTAPFTYQWKIGGIDMPGATGSSYTIASVQASDVGSYTVTVTNSVGFANSSPATLTIGVPPVAAKYNLTGFATLGTGTTGGGVILETNPAYRKVTTALEFAQALKDSKVIGAVKVIEIMNDLNLGWNEIDPAVKSLSSTPFRAHATPKLHPTLIATGVSLIDIQSKPGLTIFSANGATIKHATFNLKGTSNIIIRNLKFDEMWEWDEASKGDYDSNDWDFIDLSNGTAVTNVWIDHCTFTKAYDGIVDMKSGTQYVTMSWCNYVGDDGATNPNSFVRQQIGALEANKASYSFYNFLRNNGFSVEDIVQIIQGHDKCHLMGSNSLDAENATLSATFHHQLFQDIWDRCVPRLRAGQVHNYNIYVDDSLGLVAKRLRDLRANAMTPAAKTTLNNTYSFNPFLNGSISTEGGAILVEKSVYQDCLTPLRNNQTDITNPVYTGKILSLDSIYIFHEADGTVTTQRGNSTDAGSRMGPSQAPVIPFTWNTTDGNRPYPAPVMDDPADLEAIVSVGAGAGKISWSKDNWLKTSY